MTKRASLVLAAAVIAAAPSFGRAADNTVLGAESLTSGTVTTLGDVGSLYAPLVITQVLNHGTTANPNSWTVFATDGTASLDIYGAYPGTMSTYIPTVGDAIEVTGSWAPYHQIPELGTITSFSVISHNNPVAPPLVETISAVNLTTLPSNLAGYYITLPNVTINLEGNPPNFAGTNASMSISDSTGSMTLYYWPTSYSVANNNLGGYPVPTGPVSISGFVSVYGSGATAVPEFSPISITPLIPTGSGVTFTGAAVWDNTTTTQWQLAGALTKWANSSATTRYDAIFPSTGSAYVSLAVSTAVNVLQLNTPNFILGPGAGNYNLTVQANIVANASATLNCDILTPGANYPWEIAPGQTLTLTGNLGLTASGVIVPGAAITITTTSSTLTGGTLDLTQLKSNSGPGFSLQSGTIIIANDGQLGVGALQFGATGGGATLKLTGDVSPSSRAIYCTGSGVIDTNGHAFNLTDFNGFGSADVTSTPALTIVDSTGTNTGKLMIEYTTAVPPSVVGLSSGSAKPFEIGFDIGTATQGGGTVTVGPQFDSAVSSFPNTFNPWLSIGGGPIRVYNGTLFIDTIDHSTLNGFETYGDDLSHPVNVGTDPTFAAGSFSYNGYADFYNQAVLQVNGTVNWNHQGTNGSFAISHGNVGDPIVTVTLATTNATDLLTLQQPVTGYNGSGTNISTVSNYSGSLLKITGPGRVVLASAVTSGSTFQGTWEIDSGILQVGDQAFTSTDYKADPLYALGYYATSTNTYMATVNVNGGILAVGRDASVGTVNALPNPIVLNSGGALAGTNATGGDDTTGATSTGTALNSQGQVVNVYATTGTGANIAGPSPIGTNVTGVAFGGNLTVQGNSSVLLYDPVSTANAMTVTLSGPGNTTWSGSTLTVDPGATTGGRFIVSRSAGTTTVAPGSTLLVNPNAVLELQGTNALYQAAGLSSLGVNVTVSANASLNATSGSSMIGAVSGTGMLNISANATLTLGSGVSYLPYSSLNINALGKLNLDGASLVITNVPAGDNAVLMSLVQNGLGSAQNWTGTTGIGTLGTNGYLGANGAVTGLAAMSGAAYLALNGSSATFDGQAVTANEFLIKHTWNGDINMDGQVTLDDYLVLDAAYRFGLTQAGWAGGDLNGDGKVDGADFALADAAYLVEDGLSAAESMITLHAGWFGGDYVSMVDALAAPVPEPTSLALLGLGATALLSRRRRQNRSAGSCR